MSSTYTVRDLCERYDVTAHTVLAWIHSGKLRALNVSRRVGAKKPRYRITQEQLDAFQSSITTSAPVPAARPKRTPSASRNRMEGIPEFYR
jgi:excisionase family DNA binding protein